MVFREFSKKKCQTDLTRNNIIIKHIRILLSSISEIDRWLLPVTHSALVLITSSRNREMYQLDCDIFILFSIVTVF